MDKDLKEKLKNIKLQQEQAKELFVKCQGAIEMLNELIKEQEVSKKENKDKK
tara:strand:+ start:457 stop:612 length:156 start_codon:yes stop_codon:yes gene_type:complete